MVPPVKTILVVEHGAAIGDALRGFGYQILAAVDGRAGLEALGRAAALPDLILVDWTMPIPDGLAFLGACASSSRLGQVPVIVVSAMGRMDRIPSLYVAAVLTRPMRTRTLLEVIGRLCGGRTRERATSNHDGQTAPIRRLRSTPI